MTTFSTNTIKYLIDIKGKNVVGVQHSLFSKLHIAVCPGSNKEGTNWVVTDRCPLHEAHCPRTPALVITFRLGSADLLTSDNTSISHRRLPSTQCPGWWDGNIAASNAVLCIRCLASPGNCYYWLRLHIDKVTGHWRQLVDKNPNVRWRQLV